MPISYPLPIPTSIGIASVRMAPMAAVGVSMGPYDFSQQVQAFQGQMWAANITLPPMNRAEADEWTAFLLALNGRQGTFLMGDPSAKLPKGVATGTPLVKGGGQTGSELITDGWTPSTSNILRAGDYIQLGTGDSSRLHKVLQSVNSDVSGEATLLLWPRLRSSPADNAPIVVNNPVGLWRMASNEMAWEADIERFGLSFACGEAL